MSIVYPKTAAMAAKRQLATFGIRCEINGNSDPELLGSDAEGFLCEVGEVVVEGGYKLNKQGESIAKAGSLVTLVSSLTLTYEDLSINKRTHIFMKPCESVEKFAIVGHTSLVTPGSEVTPYLNILLTSDISEVALNRFIGRDFLTMILFKD